MPCDSLCVVVETMSAANLDELKTTKLYKTEARVVPDRHLPAQANENGPSQADYNQLKRLEEKLSRVQLKTKLYQNRRDADHTQVQELSETLHLKTQDHDALNLQI